MTFPPLLLGLYLGILSISIAIGTWVAHSRPAVEEARRVTDAAERAALNHLLGPGKLSLSAVGLLTLAAAAFAFQTEGSVLWSVTATLLPPLLIFAAVLYTARKLLRTSGQLVGVDSADSSITLTSRSCMAAVVCCDASVGITLLALHTLASNSLGVIQANHLVLIASSSINLTAVIFARSISASILTAGEATAESGTEPHPASLALLINVSFHSPLLRILSLLVVSSLGQAALILLTIGDSHDGSALWLYPHLLRFLGLLGLVFSGMVVRSKAHEPLSIAWLRGGAVHLLLMLAGIWALSSKLLDASSFVVPLSLSSLYLGLALVLYLLQRRTDAIGQAQAASLSVARAPALAVFLVLLLALLLSVLPTEKSSYLSAPVLASLLLGASLALLPAATLWLLSRDLSHAGNRARSLANGGLPLEASLNLSAPPGFLALFPLLVLIVGLSFLASHGSEKGEDPVAKLFFLGLGIATALLAVGNFLTLTRQKALPHAESVRNLQVEASRVSATTLDFEAAVSSCRDAVETGGAQTTGVLIAPVLLLVLISFFSPLSSLANFSLGLSIGGVIAGVGFDILANSEPLLTKRAVGTLGLIAGLSLSLWLLAANSFLL